MSALAAVRTWQPLLSGSEAEIALNVAEEIGAALRRRLDSPETSAPLPMGRPLFSLSGGWAGQALFCAYLDRACPGKGYDETAGSLLERTFEELSRAEAQPGLYAGLTGVAWTVEHLRGWLVDDEDEDPGIEIAERIAALLAARPWPLEYDLISGLVGFGVYAVERLPHPLGEECASRTLSRLGELAQWGPEGVSWWTVNAKVTSPLRMGSGPGHYNLGTAHGIPGVIGWLGQMCGTGGNEGEARSLLAAAVPWLLRQRNRAGSASIFPNAVIPGEEGEPSRLAWCYGDLGVAAALLTAARGAREPDWEREALDIARTAARRSPETAGVTEAGICHGAAGNAHLFNRFWQESGDAVFGEAARYWLREALAKRNPGEGLAGYLTSIPDANREMGLRPDPGFLTGVAGIGLVLLAAASPVEPAWDRLLLAS